MEHTTRDRQHNDGNELIKQVSSNQFLLKQMRTKYEPVNKPFDLQQRRGWGGIGRGRRRGKRWERRERERGRVFLCQSKPLRSILWRNNFYDERKIFSRLNHLRFRRRDWNSSNPVQRTLCSAVILDRRKYMYTRSTGAWDFD